MTRVAHRFERAAIVLTPVVSLATVALGLRIGAATRTHGALVYGAAPGAGRPGLACQLVTMADDTGVREAVSVPSMSVVATSAGHEARWQGGSNLDGVAEVWLGLPDVHWGDAVSLTATTAQGEVLARGAFNWPPAPARAQIEEAPVRPMKRAGKLWLDVFVNAGRLAPGFESQVLVRVKQGPGGVPLAGIELTANPEPGLTVPVTSARTDTEGWAALAVTADYLIASWTLQAKAPSGEPRTGEWIGALPVAPGGAFVSLPALLPAGEPRSVDVLLTTVSPRMYIEVDDAAGRDFGAAIDVEKTPRGGLARIEIPPLTAGKYWLVTSVDARGATSLSGGTLAYPFEVGEPGKSPVPRLAAVAPPAFSRFLAVDGMARRRGLGDARRRRGQTLALGSLIIAACLEILLVLRASQRAKRHLAALSEASLEAGGGSVASDLGATGLVVFVLVSLLGFALVAALLLVRTG
jgi:hypothetical protein